MARSGGRESLTTMREEGMPSLTQSLRPSIESLSRAWHGSPLPGFLRWWGGELRASLPARWRTALDRGPQWCMFRLDGEDWLVTCPGDGTAPVRIGSALTPAQQQAALQDACAGIDPHDLRLALCLPASAVLRRRLHLPLAALPRLRQVLAYEMDRQTPFRADQVHFDIRLLEKAAAGMLDVELVAVPRSRLDPLLQRLDATGLRVDAVDTLVDGQRLGVNLLPTGQRRRHRHPRQRLNLMLGGVLAALVLLAMLQWLHNRQAVIDAMQARVDTLHAKAREVMQLRKRLDASAGAERFLARQRAQSPTVLAVLEDLSKRLPADTWLERLTIGSDGSVGMQGQSPQAARLVDVLKTSPYLAEPGFQGVIRTDPRTHKERFYLTAHLRKQDTGKTDPEQARKHETASR